MLTQRGRYNIFADYDFQQHCQNRANAMKTEIYETPTDYLLNVGHEQYVEYLVNKYALEPVRFAFLDKTVEPGEADVPAENFPPMSIVERGHRYRKPVYQYYLPYAGDQQLLRAVPNPNTPVSCVVDIGEDSVSFTIVDFYGNPERIKMDAHRIVESIKLQSESLNKNIDEYNGALWDRARDWFQQRRLELEKQQKVTTALGVPIRRRRNPPETFAVPVVRKQIEVKPKATLPSFQPEPQLDESLYQEILQVIHDTGKTFERLPSTYTGKGEETLRDHFILVLEPRFESSTTGETFNKLGKTDILVRYEKSNVFVGECKFWKGQKQHQETITQLLSYLTWRDSKAAIIYFMNTKEVIPPLRAIEETTSQHSCFLRSRGKRDESWFDYEFHLSGDASRSVSVSILCFHFPPIA
jgi:hypothetical protein